MMGYGNKTDFASKQNIPSPGTYMIKSEFDYSRKKSNRKGSFALSRIVTNAFE